MRSFVIGQPVKLRWFFRRQKYRFTFHRKSLKTPDRCLLWDEWKDTYKEVAIRRVRTARW